MVLMGKTEIKKPRRREKY